METDIHEPVCMLSKFCRWFFLAMVQWGSEVIIAITSHGWIHIYLNISTLQVTATGRELCYIIISQVFLCLNMSLFLARSNTHVHTALGSKAVCAGTCLMGICTDIFIYLLEPYLTTDAKVLHVQSEEMWNLSHFEWQKYLMGIFTWVSHDNLWQEISIAISKSKWSVNNLTANG